MTGMNFSDGEKLILVMLADLYKAMKVKGEIDPDRVLASIFSNNIWSLRTDFTGLYGGEEPSSEVVEETFAILSLWREIEADYARLDRADKERLAREAGYLGKDPKFEGFDGNNDDHFGVARHIVNTMGRFEEFKGRSLNSHSSSSLDGYRRQSAVREEIARKKPTGSRSELTVDDLIKVLSA